MGVGHWAVPQIPLNEGLPALRPSQYCLRTQSCLARGAALPGAAVQDLVQAPVEGLSYMDIETSLKV